MTFSRVKPAGWLQDELLTPAQINALDINQSNAIDGAAGGIYSPGSDIELPGVNGIKWGDGRYPKLSPRLERRTLDLVKVFEFPDASWPQGWDGLSQDHVHAEAESQENDDPFLGVPVNRLIDGASLYAVRVWLKGATGHVGLPVRMPHLVLVHSTADGTGGNIGKATDASATVAVYEAAHAITFQLSTPIVIDESDESRFILQIRGEGGTYALPYLKVTAASALYLVSSLRPGG